MKIVPVLFVLLCLLCGCESADQRARTAPVAKVIVEKLIATEQRVSWDPLDSKNSVRSRAASVYYLIAEDGAILEVDLKEYARTKVGQSVVSTEWE